jgi:hypothetical protein
MGSVIAYAQSVVPGDRLYGFKITSEQVAYALAFDPAKKIELRTGFAQRRLEEAEALIFDHEYALANTAMADYVKEVGQASEMLQRMGDQDFIENKALAVQMLEDLSADARRLEAMVQRGPDEVRPALKDGIGASLSGAEAASDFLGGSGIPDQDLDQSTQTSTPTQTTTATVAPTKTKRYFTSTPLPPVEPFSVKASPTPTPTIHQRISKTPKPTNINRPDIQSPPGKDKPPNENKPDKPDKPDKKDP